MSQLISQFLSARRCGTPIIAVQTADPAATIAAVCAAVPQSYKHGGQDRAVCKIEWDLVRGFTGRDTASRDVVKDIVGKFDASQNNPPVALVMAAKLPSETLLFVHLAHRWAVCPSMGSSWVQACWLLRDVFKVDRRTLVLLGPSITLPAELAGDVIVLDEPLPNSEQLRAIVEEQFEAAADDDQFDGAAVMESQLPRAVEALQGLPAFQAEQVTALALRRDGLDLESLWDSKRRQIEQTPGLRVWRGGDSFDAIGGCAVVKQFVGDIMRGEARPNAVVFVDEIEKMLGGSHGDSSGVSQDQLGVLLSYMQDHNSTGMIFVGPPGAAKSAIAKAAGNRAGIPTIQLDLGAAKGSLVGQSEANIRSALKVITAVSNGRSLWIATCNGIADLPPELRRRFTLGTFFFDLPDEDERRAIWSIWQKHYSLPTADCRLPTDAGWTGAEIKQCCDLAWRLKCSIEQAAAFVVPVSRSAPDALERLRSGAEGRFLSASHPGVYTREPKSADHRSRRRLQVAS